MKNLEELITKAFEDRDNINKDTQGEIREAVDVTLNQLDSGTIRVCEKSDDQWIVNQWIKKAILLSFRIQDMELIDNGPTIKGAVSYTHLTLPKNDLV